jgi:hypothetical protein
VPVQVKLLAEAGTHLIALELVVVSFATMLKLDDEENAGLMPVTVAVPADSATVPCTVCEIPVTDDVQVVVVPQFKRRPPVATLGFTAPVLRILEKMILHAGSPVAHS